MKTAITLIALTAAATLFTATPAKASFDGGWGTTSFNVYEGSMGTSWNHQVQSGSGWSSFWGKLFGRGGILMPASYQ